MMRAAFADVLESDVRGDDEPAQVNIDHLVELFERPLLKGLGDGDAGVVDQDVQTAEGGDGLFNGCCYGLCARGVRLHRQRLAAGGLNGLDDS